MPRPRRRPPTRQELIVFLDGLAFVMLGMTSRWADGIAPELRAEMITSLYEPTIQKLVECGHRMAPSE